MEEQEGSQLFVRKDDHCPRKLSVAREAYRQDHVIKAERAGKIGSEVITVVIDQHEIGINSDLAQHGVEQCHLVLAIAVPASQHFAGGMWLISPYANLDGYIPNTVLHIGRQPADLLQWVGSARDNLPSFVADGLSNFASTCSQLLIPSADLCPRTVALTSPPRSFGPK